MQKIVDILWAFVLTFWPIVGLLCIVHISLSSPNHQRERVFPDEIFVETPTFTVSFDADIDVLEEKNPQNVSMSSEKQSKEDNPDEDIFVEEKKYTKTVSPTQQFSSEPTIASEKKTRSKKRKKDCPTNKNGEFVKEIDSNHYEISQEEFRYYLSHHKKALGLAEMRILSSKKERKDFRGIRIQNISCDSPLYHMGIRRGDVIVSVADTNLSSYKEMWKAYLHSKTARSFSVKIRRGTEIVIKQYTPIVM